MSVLFPDDPQPFVEPKERINILLCWIGIGICSFVLVAGVCQTQLFIKFLTRTELKEIRDHISTCRKIQGAEHAPLPKPHISFLLFEDDPTAKKKLEEAWNSLLNDEALQAELREAFGVSFRELNVVVAPSWKLSTPVNNGLVGITDDGWAEARKAMGESDVGGITLRDRPGLSKRTVDGRPRILLNAAAFGNLRLTLFHELLHAMNVPGVYPSYVTFAQNDLTYLPQYRNFVSREHLDDWHEPKIWGLAVLTPGLILLGIVRRLRRLRDRRQRVIVTGGEDVTNAAD